MCPRRVGKSTSEEWRGLPLDSCSWDVTVDLKGEVSLSLRSRSLCRRCGLYRLYSRESKDWILWESLTF